MLPGSVGWSVVLCTKAAGSIPGQGTYRGWGFDPWLGHVGEATDHVSLSPFLSTNQFKKYFLA